jgi:hypothetical protein
MGLYRIVKSGQGDYTLGISLWSLNKGVRIMMRRHVWFVPVLVVFVGVRAFGEEPTSKPSSPNSYMRFVDDGKGGGSLQTADVEFTDGKGTTVNLVGAIHIGEKDYYDGLNKEFTKYDAVLYELVKPKDMAAPAPGDGEKSSNPISQFQVLLKDTLDLDFQLDDVDYTASNFVHADLDKETFEKMQEERGETFETMFLNMLMKAWTNPPSVQDAASSTEDAGDDLISVLCHPDMERQIKVVIARQLGDMDLSSMGLDGPGGSVLVTERNKAALKVLSDEMAAGKKKMAIFYGAAHMKDMSQRLEAMGFQPVKTNWNVAWDLAIRPDEPSAMEKMLRGVVDAVNGKN